MSYRFLLFGEKPFDVYAREKFENVAAGIQNMNDVEVLMYQDDFEALARKTSALHAFPKLQISFEDKVVDLVGKTERNRTRYFAEYSLVVSGDPYFLGLSPYSSGYRPVELLVQSKENVMSFEIDTGFYSEELNTEATERVRKEYKRIQRFITSTQDNLNHTIDYYNNELEKLVIENLANKMRKALRCQKIKKVLDFK